MPSYKIEFQHEIKATPTQVRSILLDFSSYNSWNELINDPIIVKSSSNSQDPYNLRPGDVISLTFVGSQMKATPEILINTEEEFRWIGFAGAKFIFSGEHYFKLKSLDGGERCLLIHGELFKGITVPLFKWSNMAGDTEKRFLSMSLKIKERAEALS